MFGVALAFVFISAVLGAGHEDDHYANIHDSNSPSGNYQQGNQFDDSTEHVHSYDTPQEYPQHHDNTVNLSQYSIEHDPSVPRDPTTGLPLYATGFEQPDAGHQFVESSSWSGTSYGEQGLHSDPVQVAQLPTIPTHTLDAEYLARLNQEHTPADVSEPSSPKEWSQPEEKNYHK